MTFYLATVPIEIIFGSRMVLEKDRAGMGIPPIPIVLFWLIISFELPLAYGFLQVIVRFQISVEQVQSYFGQAQPFFPFCAPTPFYIKFIQ
ncbi:MAG: hypothetical protein HFH79_12110 [Lachnospiraceae bacterium]|nr:hypothetical protein [Lachnospiraceae bacterium]